MTEEYIQDRKNYRETGFDIHMVRKMKEAGLWDSYNQELSKIQRGEDNIDFNLTQATKPDSMNSPST